MHFSATVHSVPIGLKEILALITAARSATRSIGSNLHDCLNDWLYLKYSI